MPFCDVDGLRMHYHVAGEGPPLLLIMGLSGDLTWWNALLPELTPRFRVIAFDNRGAGLTDKPEGKYSIPLFATDTVGLLDALEVPRAHVFGVSMGGMIAQELCLRHPERVDRLLLGCTHSGGPGLVMPSADSIQKLTFTRGKSLPEVGRQIMSILFSPAYQEANPGTVQAMIDRYVSAPPPRKAFSQQFWAVVGHDCYDRLPGIRAPTLVLTGEEDVLVPPENPEVLHERIPGARLAYLPGAGHVFFIEVPGETARHVCDHFLGNGGGR